MNVTSRAPSPRSISIVTLLLLFAGLAVVPAARAGTQVSGTISADTTWTTAGSPYEVIGDLGVDIGVTLTIQAGVAVQLKGHYKIQIGGRLVTQGTDSMPVTFTCTSTSKNCWTGIEFTESQSGSDIDGAHIGYADLAIDTNSNPWSVTDSWLHDSNEGIHATGSCCSSVGILSHNYISSNITGVNVFFKLATFSLNTITANSKGVFLLGQDDVIQDNNIFGNSSLNMDTCFFPGDGTVNATNNWWGTTDASAIETKICHHADDLAYPTVTFQPFESAAVAGAATQPTPASPSPSPSGSASPSPSPSASASPSPEPSGPTRIGRTVSLTLRRHLVARGVVSSSGPACRSASVVSIQRRTSSGWRRIKRVAPASDGGYRTSLRDRRGRYRARVAAAVLPNGDRCIADTSKVQIHRH